jgi:hypothetical protein
MCYYTLTHGQCGHAEKLPVDPSLCICTLNNPKIADFIDAMSNVLEEPKKKYYSKFGDFKGEMQPMKQSWCPKCLVEEKARIHNQVYAEGIGSVFNKAINPGEPKIHPVTIHTKDKNKVKSFKEVAKEKEDEDEKVIAKDYPVPKVDRGWEGKTRGDIRHDMREGIFEMVDQIRVLRTIVKANGMTTEEIEQEVQARTDKRRIKEHDEKIRAELKREVKVAEHEKESSEAKAEKAAKKVAKQVKHVENLKEIQEEKARKHEAKQKEWKARVLYTV